MKILQCDEQDFDAVITSQFQPAYIDFYKVLAVVVTIFSIILLTGCASFSLAENNQNQTLEVEPAKITIDSNLTKIDETDSGWWQIGLHRNYKYDDEVQWQYDTFLALKVFKPIIDQEKGIKLWRFHRRAVPDKTAHRFSFIFYSSRKVGEAIYRQVAEHSIIKNMLDNHYLDNMTFYDINNNLRTDLAGTSDKSWPIELQRTWPYFIMGVSQTWLGLIEHYYNELNLAETADLDDQLEGFKKVSDKLDIVWKHSGSHAFLHHLNALFAYQELYIVERSLRRF